MRFPQVIFVTLVVFSLLLVPFAASADLDAAYDSFERHFNAAVGPVCICSCSYSKNLNIKVPRYFETGEVKTCGEIDDMACIANHRGTMFEGITKSCSEAPRPVNINSAVGDILKVPVGSIS